MSRVKCRCYRHFYEAFGHSDTGLAYILEFKLLKIFYIYLCTYTEKILSGKFLFPIATV